MQTRKLIVSGKVQGVSYRFYCLAKAVELNLEGYVQNQPDGSVLILATGDIASLDALEAWSRTGSPRARVDSVISHPEPLQEFSDFSILK